MIPDDKHDGDLFPLIVIAFAVALALRLVIGCAAPVAPQPVDAAPDAPPYAAPEPGMVLQPSDVDAAAAPLLPCPPPWCPAGPIGHRQS